MYDREGYRRFCYGEVWGNTDFVDSLGLVDLAIGPDQSCNPEPKKLDNVLLVV